MRLYQVREHVYSSAFGLVRHGFTNHAEAERYFRNAAKAAASKSCRISLHLADVPDRLSMQDWAAILSDDGIPGIQWEQMEIHVGTEDLAA